MIRNIVFDMGMVLMMYDPMTACMALTEDRALSMKLKAAIFDHPEWQNLLDTGKLTDEEYIPYAQARVDTPAEKALVRILLRTWWQDGMYPIPGMKDCITKLAEKGYHLYVLSNAGYSARLYCHKIPAFELFSGVLFSAEEKMCKPEPAFYQRLLEKYGLKAEECVFVDDLPRNLEGAASVGMKTLWQEKPDGELLSANLEKLLAREQQ